MGNTFKPKPAARSKADSSTTNYSTEDVPVKIAGAPRPKMGSRSQPLTVAEKRDPVRGGVKQ